MIQNNPLSSEKLLFPEANFLQDEVSCLSSEACFQSQFLHQLFCGREGIDFTIACLRGDRLTNSSVLTQIIKEKITDISYVDAKLIEENPLLALLVLMKNENPSEDHLRILAAETYSAHHPEDTRFEKAYAYLRAPHILIAHLLIVSKEWQCSNPENLAFYDEQLAGLFHGTVALDKGDRITQEELAKIQAFEGENPRFPIANCLERQGNDYLVKKWYCTPAMCPLETRLDDLFIKSRRNYQSQLLGSYLQDLTETSKIVSDFYNLPSDSTAVVAVIGPYGSGKSYFTRRHFDDKVTTFDLDSINARLMSPLSKKQDHHFEAMMLNTHLLKEVAKIPVLYTETAAIDEFRFNRLINRDFASRDQIIIQEIAVHKALTNVDQFQSREGTIDLSRLSAAETSVKDAQKFRAQRIKLSQDNPKISYTLFCNQQEKGFILVAIVESGNFVLGEDYEGFYEGLYHELCPPSETLL